MGEDRQTDTQTSRIYSSEILNLRFLNIALNEKSHLNDPPKCGQSMGYPIGVTQKINFRAIRATV